MKKLIVLLMALMLCFASIPALSETIDSQEFNPGITMTLPNPDWKVEIHCDQQGKTLLAGSKVTLTAKITTEQSKYYKLSDYNISYNWLAKQAANGDWESVGSKATYDFELDADNVNWIFKVTVTLSK